MQRGQERGHAGEQDGIEKESPERQPPGGKDADAYRTHRGIVLVAVEMRPDGQGVPSVRKIGVGGGAVLCRRGLPVPVETAQHVCVPYALGIGEFRNGIVEGEGIGGIGEDYVLRLHDMLVEDVVLASGHVFDLLVRDRQAREDDGRDVVELLADHPGVECRHTLGASEEQLPASALEDGSDAEFIALQAVVFVISGHLSRLGIDAREAV